MQNGGNICAHDMGFKIRVGGSCEEEIEFMGQNRIVKPESLDQSPEPGLAVYQ